MSEEKYIVRVLNTFTNRYEEVEVSQEVYKELTRSKWNMAKKHSTIRKREISVNEINGDLPDSFEEYEQFDSGEKGPIDLLEDKEAYEDLMKKIEKLSPVMQRRIHMKFIEGLSTETIARIDGVTETAIKICLGIAKKNLKAILANTKEGD